MKGITIRAIRTIIYSVEANNFVLGSRAKVIWADKAAIYSMKG